YYPPKMLVGAALFVRIPTHTTKFKFSSPAGDLDFDFPRYVHIAPSVLFATSYGPFSFFTNQGALLMPGTSVKTNISSTDYPSLFFYDGHFTVGMFLPDA